MLVPVALLIFVTHSSQTATTIEDFLSKPISKKAEELTGEALVKYVNKQQSFFQAEYSGAAEQRMRNLMGMEFVEESGQNHGLLTAADPISNKVTIPKSFDSRQEWKYCPTIRDIRDQSNCGSCWAVSAAETMSDRLCIHSRGKRKMRISDTDILSCCGDFCGSGCNGGYSTRAWLYAKQYGVCSGGQYEEQGVCKPYVFHPCGWHRGQKYYGECPKHLYKTPLCREYCQYGYGKRYKQDKVFATGAYMVPKSEERIQLEIVVKGPVQAAFTVYEDFGYYKKGVYVHTSGRPRGRHAVKIIGWGVQNGTKYWTVANSWNIDWGEDGFFRIVRGVNNCGIEEAIVAGNFFF
uniref:Pept_C1 domain-containing protein n=1 Tax=Haemonchus contortus TaxID=6289 RepID=A0A7I4XUN1_HAECO